MSRKLQLVLLALILFGLTSCSIFEEDINPTIGHWSSDIFWFDVLSNKAVNNFKLDVTFNFTSYTQHITWGPVKWTPDPPIQTDGSFEAFSFGGNEKIKGKFTSSKTCTGTVILGGQTKEWTAKPD